METVMRPRALVVHPPVSIARDFIDYPYFADLGAVQLAAVLRARGDVDVGLVDAYATDSASLSWRADGRAHLGGAVSEVVARAEEWLRVAGRNDAIVVCTTPFHRPPARDDVMGELLQSLRGLAPSSALVLADAYQSGQHYVEADGAAMLASYPEADAWLKYEAEESLPSLLSELRVSRASARGVRHGRDVSCLDDLPFPAWDMIDLDARDRFCARVVANLGRGEWEFPIDGRTLPMITSRGCPFTCRHCSSNPGRLDGAPKTQRRLSPARMRDHLDALVRTHRATRVEVLDELVNVNASHFDAFLDLVAELDIAFDVPNGMRADYLENEHFRKMRGRVRTVSVSAESGVQRVVDEVVGKRLDLSSIERAAENAHAAGVPLMIHFMIGLPGETEREVDGTLSFALDLFRRFRARPAVQFATPLPGTELARGRTLPVVSDWGPMFQTSPSQPDALVAPEMLVSRKRAFEERTRAVDRRSRAPRDSGPRGRRW